MMNIGNSKVGSKASIRSSWRWWNEEEEEEEKKSNGKVLASKLWTINKQSKTRMRRCKKWLQKSEQLKTINVSIWLVIKVFGLHFANAFYLKNNINR